MKFIYHKRLFNIVIILVFLILPGKAAADKSYIVGFKEPPGLAEKDLIHGARGMIKRTYRLIPAVVADLSEQEAEKLKENRHVSYVEEDGIMSVVQAAAVGEYMDAWNVSHIGADVVHSNGITGLGIKIAVVDSGIDYTHPDLNDNYRGGYDFVFDDADPFDDSYNSHGTHVAGIVAAESNGTGVVGVAPHAELYAVKVLDGAGFGLTSWIIAALEWAVTNQMDIANISVGDAYNYQPLEDACNSAYEAGLLIVASAGNTKSGPVLYPAAYESVIAVTATTQDDGISFVSPDGPEIELAAPGAGIWSTLRDGYGYLTGTSQAAPHVTGTAALVLASPMFDRNSDGLIDHKDVRMTLQITAMDLGIQGRDSLYGFGLIDAAAASSLQESIFLTIKRTPNAPSVDSVQTSLSDAHYTVIITNHGLKRIQASVVENGLVQNELGYAWVFKKYMNHVTWDIDATGKSYDIVFTPQGTQGASADIEIFH